MFGQAGAFAARTPRNEAAHKKFVDESKRLAGVLDERLKGREWIAADSYSIADIACYPWFEGIAKFEPAIVEDVPEVRAWMDRLAKRPRCRRASASARTPNRPVADRRSPSAPRRR